LTAVHLCGSVILFFDLSYFYAELKDIPLGGGLVTLRNAVLEVDARDRFSLQFQSSLTCLFMTDVTTNFTIMERLDESGHELFDINLQGFTSTLGLQSSITVDATLDPAHAINSEIREFDINLADGIFTLEGSYEARKLRGTFAIPAIFASGYGLLETDELGAQFEGAMSVFSGLIRPHAFISLRWDLSYLFVKLDNIQLAGNLLNFRNLILEVSNIQEDFDLDFQMSVTFLFLLDAESSLRVSQSNENDEDFNISFYAYTDTIIGRSSMNVTGVLNGNSISQSTFDIAAQLADFVFIGGQYSDGKIHGDFDLPLLGIHGHVSIVTYEITNTASFESKVSLFGNVLSEEVTLRAEWSWDLTFFHGFIDAVRLEFLEISGITLLINAGDERAEFYGRVSIPLLGCDSKVKILSDSSHAQLDAHIGLFDEFVYVLAHVEWAWSGNRFFAQFENTRVGFLEVKEARVEFEKLDGVSFVATANLTITFLGIEVANAQAQVEEHGIDLITTIGPDFLQLSGRIVFSGQELLENAFPTEYLFEMVDEIEERPKPLPPQTQSHQIDLPRPGAHLRHPSQDGKVYLTQARSRNTANSIIDGQYFSYSVNKWQKVFGDNVHGGIYFATQLRNDVDIWTGEVIVFSGNAPKGTTLKEGETHFEDGDLLVPVVLTDMFSSRNIGDESSGGMQELTSKFALNSCPYGSSSSLSAFLPTSSPTSFPRIGDYVSILYVKYCELFYV